MSENGKPLELQTMPIGKPARILLPPIGDDSDINSRLVDQGRTILHLALPLFSPWFTHVLVWYYIQGSSVQIIPNKFLLLSKGSEGPTEHRVLLYC